MNIEQVTINGDQVTFLFKGTSNEAAKLRAQIIQDITFKLIDSVTFHKNTSNINNEKIAHRLGLLITKSDHVGVINVKGPKKVKAKHIETLECLYPNTLLLQLNKDEELHCELVVKNGSGKIHQKWNPVYGITFTESNEGYHFKLGLIGSLTFDEILEQLKIINHNI